MKRCITKSRSVLWPGEFQYSAIHKKLEFCKPGPITECKELWRLILMFRIGPLPFTPGLTSTSARGNSRALSGGAKRAQDDDEVALSKAATAVPQDRSALLAALRISVSSPDYFPPSLPISQKLVAGALSRSN
jgi:hypothetical protein